MALSFHAAVTKSGKWQLKCISHSCGWWSPRSRASMVASGARSLRALRWLASPVMLMSWKERGSQLSGDSCEGTNPIHEGFRLMTSPAPNSFPTGPPAGPSPGKVSFEPMKSVRREACITLLHVKCSGDLCWRRRLGSGSEKRNFCEGDCGFLTSQSVCSSSELVTLNLKAARLNLHRPCCGSLILLRYRDPVLQSCG